MTSPRLVREWTRRASFLAELEELLGMESVSFAEGTRPAPYGAHLETTGSRWLQGSPVWNTLRNWWLVHNGNRPKWDIAVPCAIEDRPGLVLVEAKANRSELSTNGKGSEAWASAESIENHESIRAAIEEACHGLRRLHDSVDITQDSHYQLASRLAYTWRLATLRIPTVLVHLGFLGDSSGLPFVDQGDWLAALSQYVAGRVPIDLFEKRLMVGDTPLWLLSRCQVAKPYLLVS